MKKYQFNLKKLFEIMNKKKVYLLQIFTNLIFQILVTFVIFYKVNYDIINNNNIIFIMLILFQFGIIFIFSLNIFPYYINFLLMTLFSVISGLIFIRLKKYVSPEIIKTAIFGTLGIFVSMFIFALILFAFGIYLDYRVGLFLLFLLLLLIIIRIVVYIMNEYHSTHKILAIISVIIFSIFIVYDTNNILHNDSTDPIGASMSYYLDIINIFTNLVSN